MSGVKILLNTWRDTVNEPVRGEPPDMVYSDNITKQIITRMLNSGNNQVKQLGKELDKLYKNKASSVRVKTRIYTLVKNIADDGSPNNHTKLEISETKYKKLVSERKQGIISDLDNQLLEKALFTKVCHCVKKRLSNETAKWLLGDIDKDLDNLPYNPYAVCTSSIYNKRGFTRDTSFSKCK